MGNHIFALLDKYRKEIANIEEYANLPEYQKDSYTQNRYLIMTNVIADIRTALEKDKEDDNRTKRFCKTTQ